jgi:hypothetical protein
MIENNPSNVSSAFDLSAVPPQAGMPLEAVEAKGKWHRHPA